MLLLILLPVYIILAAAVGHWTLGPVNQRAGLVRLPRQFLLTDFLWLMLQLQVVLAITVPFYSAESFGNARWVILGTLLACVLAMWSASVSAVSRAGITQPLRRATALLVLIPGSLAVISAGPFCVAGIFFGVLIASGHVARQLDSFTAGALVAFSVLFLPTVGAAIGLRYLAKWVVAPPAGSSSAASS